MDHAAPSKSAARAQLGLVGSTLAYVVMALACLRQSGPSHPWSRLDIFSGSLLALLIASAVIGLTRGRRLFESGTGLQQAAGTAYDKATLVLAPALASADALIFLDYGHWHLTPWLERPPLQILGLLLGAVSMAWIAYTDAQLTRHFGDPQSAQGLITAGPFRYIRHPRYAGILGVRIAYALTLASLVGWVLAMIWFAILLRRIRLEEAYLHTQFEDAYEVYAARTPRLIPGLY